MLRQPTSAISAKNVFGDALTGNGLPTIGTPAAVDGETINSKTYSNVWKVSVDPANGVIDKRDRNREFCCGEFHGFGWECLARNWRGAKLPHPRRRALS